MHRYLLPLLALPATLSAQLGPNGATASWKGALPPAPTADIGKEEQTALESRLHDITNAFREVKKHAHAADADIFLKAVRYALEFHEWYDKKAEDGPKKAHALLDEAAKRIDALKAGKTPWLDGPGQKVLGFYSDIDDSPQPYGVEVPEGLAAAPPVPMWIWLHGRGDTATDLSFVYSRLNAKKPGQFQPKGTIVIHPFGRFCNGWKSAGETDVFECRDAAMKRFKIDPDRIVLAGFSMGGAGAWHLGAHFPDQWACVHTGAGFVDVKRYQKLTPDKMPPWYEQKLWGVYDVPDCARNFFNVPLVCYSGENDSQRDSAEYMTQILAKEGLKPPHFIGPGMGHKYHPEVIKEVQAAIEGHVAKGRNSQPVKVSIQTKTLAYSRVHWLAITDIDEQWSEARADAEWDKEKNEIRITTKNVAGLQVFLQTGKEKVLVDGEIKPGATTIAGTAVWSWNKNPGTTKRPGLSGPIDDAFKRRFVIVLPDQPADGSKVDAWARAEAAHFITRWRSLMRGDVKAIPANQLTDRDAEDANLSVWGTPKTNSFIQKLMTTKAMKKVLTWDDKEVKIGTHSAPADTHAPVLVQPNPMSPSKYVVINSGLTFREAHDRTNSLQNPKLPDWAILDITQPPNAEAAGKVVAADFFDAQWGAK